MIKSAQLKLSHFIRANFNLVQIATMSLMTLIMIFANPLIAATSDGTIWSTAQGASSNFWSNLQNIYCNALFLPLAGLSLIGWAVFAKDEKARGRFATALKFEAIVFIALQLPSVAMATLNQFASWLNGGT